MPLRGGASYTRKAEGSGLCPTPAAYCSRPARARAAQNRRARVDDHLEPMAGLPTCAPGAPSGSRWRGDPIDRPTESLKLLLPVCHTACFVGIFGNQVRCQ